MLGWVNLSDREFGIVLELCSLNLEKLMDLSIVMPGQGESQRQARDLIDSCKAKWALQIASALQYLHVQVPQITHGDVHLMNVMLSSEFNQLKLDSVVYAHAILCDFDHSCIEGNRVRCLSKMELFPRFADTTLWSGKVLVAMDWMHFGFTLLSVSFGCLF